LELHAVLYPFPSAVNNPITYRREALGPSPRKAGMGRHPALGRTAGQLILVDYIEFSDQLAEGLYVPEENCLFRRQLRFW
jgi:hypothetical protein